MTFEASEFKLDSMIEFFQSLAYFKKPAIEVDYQPGENPQLLIVTGDNATGKSFFSRLIYAYCKKKVKEKIEVFPLSMATRTGSGIHLAFMLSGPEYEESTGTNSAFILKGGFNSAKEREHDTILLLDEPDIGLSEPYSGAMGDFIAQQIKEKSENIKLIVLTSHSKFLISRLVKSLFIEQEQPNHLRFGDKQTLFQWLYEEQPEKTIDDLLSLPNKSRELMKEISRIERTK